jgi:hypothetical protein
MEQGYRQQGLYDWSSSVKFPRQGCPKIDHYSLLCLAQSRDRTFGSPHLVVQLFQKGRKVTPIYEIFLI